MKIFSRILISKKYCVLTVLVLTACIVDIGLSGYTFNLQKEEQRIVSVNGTVSEILCAIGLENAIVGVDVTSTYPASLDKIAKVGHNRNVSAEGIMALNPTLVTGVSNDLKFQVIDQMKAAQIRTQLFRQEYSVEGTKSLLKKVAAYFNLTNKGNELISQLNRDLTKVSKSSSKRKVLFIYARGAGTMMVAGKGTAVEKMIELAGGQNVVTDFNDFKPLTAESLVASNPDVILMFESGLQSMGGIDGLLKVQGIAQTNAGKNKKVIQMDGQLLTGFGPRLGMALIELSSKIQ